MCVQLLIKLKKTLVVHVVSTAHSKDINFSHRQNYPKLVKIPLL